jgi:hypothetical protein
MTEPVHKLAWVTARAECSPRAAFARLLAAVESDVTERNALRSNAETREFELFVSVADADSLFSVVRDRRATSIGVRFRFDGQTVGADHDTIGPVAKGAPFLDADGRCKFRVGDEVLEEWQFRMRALESLFFSR